MRVKDLIISFMTLSNLLFLVSFTSADTALNTASRKYSLSFDKNNYTIKEITINGQSLKYRAYTGIIYVAKPIDEKYQQINIFVPEIYYEMKKIGNYTLETAPIFLPNTVGGYLPGFPGKPGIDENGNPNAIAAALLKGIIVAAPGVRGRTNKGGSGLNTGKAPACIIDLKAAVRYLRFNDKVIPGDSERIISNGTSAGGAISALLAASGNSTDYESYLREIGAADTRDDIFAASCYCPITNLDNADAAYEWQFNKAINYKKNVISETADGHLQRKEIQDTLTSEQIALSAKLKLLFPFYLNKLNLKTENGTQLSLTQEGEGTFKEYLIGFIIKSAQAELDKGNSNLSSFEWITVKGNKVISINYDRFIAYITRMKTPPAFDGVDLGTGENDLFGTGTLNAQHFTDFGYKNSTVKGKMAEPQIVKLMNPMNYIGTKDAVTAKYWRIRHGTVDRDTSFAIPIILATHLKNTGYMVDFSLSWDRPHSGDYDLDELFEWISGLK